MVPEGKGKLLGIQDGTVAQEVKKNELEVGLAGFHLPKVGDRAVKRRRSKRLRGGNEEIARVCDVQKNAVNQEERGREKKEGRETRASMLGRVRFLGTWGCVVCHVCVAC